MFSTRSDVTEFGLFKQSLTIVFASVLWEMRVF